MFEREGERVVQKEDDRVIGSVNNELQPRYTLDNFINMNRRQFLQQLLKIDEFS